MTTSAVVAGLAMIAWVYVGLPALLAARARIRPRAWLSAAVTPSVTMVIAAHNEAGVIDDKIATVLALDYPADRLELVVASDGSTDGTQQVVTSRGDPRVRLLDLQRHGKAHALNHAVAASRGDILVFTDANSMLPADAVRALVRPFADPGVGAVAGDQRYLRERATADVAAQEARYWSLDRRLKEMASRAGSATSATGALHAIRRELFEPVPDGVTDDFFISTGAVEQHRRLVFAGDANVFEPLAGSAALEFDRKVRVISRGLRAVWARRALLSPSRHGFYAVQLLTHKVLRRLVAVPLAVVAVASVIGASEHRWLAWLVAAQAVLYAAAAAGLVLTWAQRRVPRLLRIPAYFCLVNLAAVVALVRVATGSAPVRWEPRHADDRDDRPAEAHSGGQVAR